MELGDTFSAKVTAKHGIGDYKYSWSVSYDNKPATPLSATGDTLTGYVCSVIGKAMIICTVTSATETKSVSVTLVVSAPAAS